MIVAPGSTDLTMSITVRPATTTAVSASISTPVRSAVRTWADYVDAVVGHLQIDAHRVQGDRMAQRHEIRRPLGRSDPGDPCHRKHIALGNRGVPDQRDGRRREHHPTARRRLTHRGRPVRDVDHVGGAGRRRGGRTAATGHVNLLRHRGRTPGRRPPRRAASSATCVRSRRAASRGVPEQVGRQRGRRAFHMVGRVAGQSEHGVDVDLAPSTPSSPDATSTQAASVA